MYGLLIDDPKLNFASSHFIVEHDKCEHLHGHNYTVEVELMGSLDKDRMVIDFKKAKDRVKALCDNLDHSVLLPSKSKALTITETNGQIEVKLAEKFYSFPKDDCTILPTLATTAEELAAYFYRELKKTLPQLTKVYIAESEGSKAFYSD